MQPKCSRPTRASFAGASSGKIRAEQFAGLFDLKKKILGGLLLEEVDWTVENSKTEKDRRTRLK